MKKVLRPLGLVLVFVLLTLGTYAAVSGDSLVSLSYLLDVFTPRAVQAGTDAAGRMLQETYDSARAELNEKTGNPIAAGSSSETLQRREWSDGQIITLPTGGGFLLLDGSATLVHTGTVVDATAGALADSGAALVQDHRYVVGEDTDAAVTVRSGQAAIGVQGGYTVTAGKTDHTPFYDVSQSDWYYAPVGYVYEEGLFAGTDDNHFSPGTAMNRAMLVSVLHRRAGSPEQSEGPSFADVPDGEWYSRSVRWAAANGVTSGTGADSFSPFNEVTREQTVTMMYNYAIQYRRLEPGTGADLSHYADVDRLSSWAQTSMAWAVENKIVSGVESGGVLTLEPQRSATRAEMATMLRAFCENIL